MKNRLELVRAKAATGDEHAKRELVDLEALIKKLDKQDRAIKSDTLTKR